MILGYNDIVIGETENRYFDKYFQYSIDNGLNWSNWIQLTNENLQSINTKPNHIFLIRYKYIRAGSDNTELLEFKSINLICDFVDIWELPNYSSFNLSKLNEYINVENLNWLISVIAKFYDRGIIPSYIERGENSNENWEDEDYINFWWSLIYFYSLIINYDRKLANVLFDKDLLHDYLIGRGLYLEQKKDLDKLTYLANNFFNEIFLRGTLSIVRKIDSENKVNGELLRLINYDVNDEFIFGVSDSHKSGWVLNRQSPTYMGLRDFTNVIKGYEFTKDFVSKDSYPLINSLELYITQDGNKGVLYSESESESGIGATLIDDYIDDLSKMIVVDQGIDYEIIFCVKKDSASIISVGVDGFNTNGLKIDNSFVSALDNSIFTDFFVENSNEEFVEYDIFSCIIRSNSYPDGDTNNICRDIGNNLKFSDKRVKYIVPKVTFSGGDVFLYDFKVRPLKTDFSRCFLNLHDYILAFLKNRNKEYSNSKVNDILEDFLLPYSSRLLITNL